MISTEKAFEILPHISDIYEKIDIKEFVAKYKKNFKGNKKEEENQIIAGMDLFSYLFKQSGKIKDEIFNIIAIIDDKDIEEVKQQPLTQTLGKLKDIFTEKDLVGFFKEAM